MLICDLICHKNWFSRFDVYRINTDKFVYIHPLSRFNQNDLYSTWVRMREGELWELQRMGRHSSVPPSSASDIGVSHQLNASHHQLRMIGNAEDLHAWSIYRQVKYSLISMLGQYTDRLNIVLSPCLVNIQTG